MWEKIKLFFLEIFFNPHFIYIATSYPNNFFHKLYLSIALLDKVLYHHITLLVILSILYSKDKSTFSIRGFFFFYFKSNI